MCPLKRGEQKVKWFSSDHSRFPLSVGGEVVDCSCIRVGSEALREVKIRNGSLVSKGRPRQRRAAAQ